MSHSFRRTLAPALLLALTLLALAAGPTFAAPSPSPLTAQPSAQDFGLVRVDQGEQTSYVWIQNASADPVALGGSTLDGASAFRINNDGCAGQQLASGQGCNVGVGFDPSDDVPLTATLHVPTAGFEDLDVPLSGLGGLQQVTLDPSSLDFGAVAVGDSTVRAFTLTSTGNLPFQTIVALPSGGDVGAFRVERDGCSLQQLATGAACDVAVRFTPSAAATYSATLLMVGGNDAPTVVPLRGSGVAPAATPAAAGDSTAAAPAAPPALLPADVTFGMRAGMSATFARGRVDLGVARCVGAERCRAVVRARVFALATGSQGALSSARTDVVLWGLRASGSRVGLSLPAGLRGTPSLLVARLRIHAVDRPTGVRTLVVPLTAGPAASATHLRRR